MKIINIISIIVLMSIIFSFLSCNNNNNLSDDSFTIPIFVNNPPTFYRDSPTFYKDSKMSSMLSIESKPYEHPIEFRYSYEKKMNLFQDVDIEVFFTLWSLSDPITKQAYCLIGIRKDVELWNFQPRSFGDKAFVIFWSNNEYKPSDTMFTETSRYYYTNDIDESTDSLFTTLDKDIIKDRFPKFKGHIKRISIDSIVIDYSFCISDVDFFSAIKIYDFKLGVPWFSWVKE